MKKYLFILAAIFALSTNQASADEGIYAGVFGGANWLNVDGHRHNNKFNDGLHSNKVSANFDVGYLVGGSVGYRWCGGLRVEGEIAYRHNQIKNAHFKRLSNTCDEESFSSSDNNRFRLKGNVHTVSYMANVLYDIPFECSPVKAYVGFGLGYANQKFSTSNKKSNNCNDDYSYSDYSYSCSDSSSSSDSCHHRKKCKDDGFFAAQAIIGVAYNICDCYDVTLEYRYFYTGRNNVNSNNNAIAVGLQSGF